MALSTALASAHLAGARPIRPAAFRHPGARSPRRNATAPSHLGALCYTDAIAPLRFTRHARHRRRTALSHSYANAPLALIPNPLLATPYSALLPRRRTHLCNSYAIAPLALTPGPWFPPPPRPWRPRRLGVLGGSSPSLARGPRV